MTAPTRPRCRYAYVIAGLAVCTGSLAPAGLDDIGIVLFDYTINGVPDLDQKRDFDLGPPLRQGLPENDPSTCAGDPMQACIEDFDCGDDLPCKGVGGAMCSILQVSASVILVECVGLFSPAAS